MQDMVVFFGDSAPTLYKCPIYELDEVLGDSPSFCPMEGDALDYLDSDISSVTDTTASVTAERVDIQ